jgi:hypothetical protein
MPGESAKKQREKEPDQQQKHGQQDGHSQSGSRGNEGRGENQGRGGVQGQQGTHQAPPSRQQGSSSHDNEARGGPRSLGQRGTRQQSDERNERDRGDQGSQGSQDTARGESSHGTGRGRSENQKSSEIGGPGPHGSYDPETNERNKNKPLTDDWGKTDKH